VVSCTLASVFLSLYFDQFFFQFAAMKEELECATIAVEKSDAKLKRFEIQLKQSNKKV
jgi:hypothetical protein